MHFYTIIKHIKQHIKIPSVREGPFQSALPQSFTLPFPAAPAIMADVVAEQVVDQKPVQEQELNGEAEDKEEPDPVEETAKKKKKKKKKNKSVTTGETVSNTVMLTDYRG